MSIREQGITIVTSDLVEEKRIRKALMLMGLAVNAHTCAEPIIIKCMPDLPEDFRASVLKPSNRPDREMRKDWARREKNQKRKIWRS